MVRQRGLLKVFLFSAFALFFASCASGGGGFMANSSETVNAEADKAMYQPIDYANAGKKGPQVIVIPGQIKSSNATFSQKITTNNIADFAEIELSNASFRVLERSDLGPMLDEISLAVNMGDPDSIKKFRKGKFKSTKWFMKFDVLKAEPVVNANRGFDGRFLGGIAGALMGGRSGAVTDNVASSVQSEESAGIWIIGMRYKILDAETSEQVATGYFEDKMELGRSAGGILGFSSGQEKIITLDTLAQRLVQKCVQDIDRKHK
ncbi:MAG: hypothetical protein PHN38_07870 [Sulfurospirillaceae bacterium]|nr:hypothetical protein [Sulfurospirillaceae bacterium]